MQCPFCHKEKDEHAPVCGSCGRDTAVPQALLDERAELIDMRDKLRAELEQAQARLSTRRRWLSRSRRA